ncbi:hypothetical protein M3Y95_01012300 [Aphelenchoides besseyi]|nr:hypothetical protein M3Y95_01012300 [Aphelenchoides besseyi]
MGKFFPFCGPKLSMFCMIMSIWGVIFLGLLGLFFYMNAVTLFPDLGLSEEEEKGLQRDTIEQKYSEKATQCWTAAGMYLVTFIVVFWQNKFNTTQVF